MPSPAEADLDTVMHQPFRAQACCHAGACEHLNRTLLEYAGADPAQHVFSAAPFDDDRVDALPLQQLS